MLAGCLNSRVFGTSIPLIRSSRRCWRAGAISSLGINLHGARNSALQHLVKEAPPPIVAELLGYSYQVAHLHAQRAAQTWSQYAAGSANSRRTKPTGRSPQMR